MVKCCSKKLIYWLFILVFSLWTSIHVIIGELIKTGMLYPWGETKTNIRLKQTNFYRNLNRKNRKEINYTFLDVLQTKLTIPFCIIKTSRNWYFRKPVVNRIELNAICMYIAVNSNHLFTIMTISFSRIMCVN